MVVGPPFVWGGIITKKAFRWEAVVGRLKSGGENGASCLFGGPAGRQISRDSERIQDCQSRLAVIK